MTGTDDTIDCEEILRKSNDWALNENEFDAEEEFEKVLNSNRNKDSFLYSIITFLYNELISDKRFINSAADSESNDLEDSYSSDSSAESGQ